MIPKLRYDTIYHDTLHVIKRSGTDGYQFSQLQYFSVKVYLYVKQLLNFMSTSHITSDLEPMGISLVNFNTSHESVHLHNNDWI